MKKYLFIIVFFSSCLSVYGSQIFFNTLPEKDIANFLGWTKIREAKNLCGGYYYQPSIVFNYPSPPEAKKIPVTITADKQVLYSERGDSILTGNVTITQPGREIIADKVVIHRNLKTGKNIDADLIGHVQLREFGRLVVGDHGYLNFETKVVVINNAIYHLSSDSPTGRVNLWGRVQRAIRDQSHVLTLYHASCSTCQPVAGMWHFTSRKVRLNKKTGIGTANDTVFYIRNIPSFYLPYLSFPIDNRRKTGFLFPSIGYSKDSGYTLFLPFYLNLAPNYDATLTPKIYSKHGVLADGVFRYLTATSYGQLKLDYIYNDRAFAKFKDRAASKYLPNDSLSRLEKSSNNRGAFSFQNQTKFNDYWSNYIDLNYVTDDYYLSDFGDLPAEVNNNQLPNRFDLNYDSEHWRFLGRIQAFQALHQLDDSAQDQYNRLPQLNLIGTYPNQKYGFTYQLNSEFVYFDNRKYMFDTEIPNPIGSRINLQPAISLPLNWDGVFINPKLQVAGTFYSLENRDPNNPTSINRILPILDIDSGLLFERDIHFIKNDYTQTLEPRIFYLYVPKNNQSNIPTFDTNLSRFNFDNLFRTNRFSSIDRIGDANQFTLALISRFLKANSGEEKLRVSVGQILAIQKHTVCDENNNCSADPLTENKTSPVYGELKYYLSHNWNVTGNAAWDFHNNQVNSSTANFQYRPNDDHIVNLGYNYLVDGDSFNNKTVNLNRINVSVAWLIWQHWRALGDWNYNFSYHNAQTYFYGLEYNSCCWAIRFINARIYKIANKFDYRYYVQFLFKGLGSVGNADPSGLLAGNISGYKNIFTRRLL